MFFQNSHEIVILSGAAHRFIAWHRTWWRGVEGPRGCLSCLCRSELFNHRNPRTGSCCGTHVVVTGTSSRAASLWVRACAGCRGCRCSCRTWQDASSLVLGPRERPWPVRRVRASVV